MLSAARYWRCPLSKLYAPKIGEVVSFLRENGFYLDRENATSHAIFTGIIDGVERHVSIPTPKEKGRNMGFNLYSDIVRLSGISKEKWVNYFAGKEEKTVSAHEAPDFQDLPPLVQRQLEQLDFHKNFNKDSTTAYYRLELQMRIIEEKNAMIGRLMHSLQILENIANKKTDLWIKKSNMELPFLTLHVRAPLRENGHMMFLEALKGFAKAENWQKDANGECHWIGAGNPQELAANVLGETDVDSLCRIKEEEERQIVQEKYWEFREVMKQRNREREEAGMMTHEIRPFSDWYINIYPKEQKQEKSTS